MSNLKIFSDKIPVAGKRIIVRLDLNVPIKNSKIDDDTRINIIKPLIINLIKNKAKIIIISHLGRPEGQILADLSLQPIFEYFKKKISEKVFFYKGNICVNLSFKISSLEEIKGWIYLKKLEITEAL